jgi:hypothetical protein
MSHRAAPEVQLLAHDVGKDFARLRGLEVQIEVDGRLHALVAQNVPHELVFARPVFEEERARRMSELVHGDTSRSSQPRQVIWRPCSR